MAGAAHTNPFASCGEACVHCGGVDFQPGFGPRTLILCCACLDRGTHVECEERAKSITIDPCHMSSEWHCCNVRSP